METNKQGEELKKKQIKMTLPEYDIILKMANKYTAGNTSLWMRYASMNHIPPEEDLCD